MTTVVKDPTEGLIVIVTLAGEPAIEGAIVIVRLAQTLPGILLPLFRIKISETSKAFSLPFFGLPPPVSATAIPNPPSSNSNRGMILAINNRGDIEVFFKLKFLFVIV